MMMMMGCHNNHDLKMKKIRQQQTNNKRKKNWAKMYVVRLFKRTQNQDTRKHSNISVKFFFRSKKKNSGNFSF